MRALAVLLCALAAPAVPQVPPGRLIGVVAPGAPPAAPFVLIEPLRGTVDVVVDAAGLLPGGALAALPRSGGLTAALAVPAPGTARLAAVDLAGTRVTAVRPLTQDLGEPVVGLATLDSGRVGCATPSRVLVLDTASRPSLAGTARTGESFVALTVLGPNLVALARGSSGPAAPSLHLIDPTTARSATHPLPVRGATSVTADASLGALVVGDDQGGLHVVETTRFIASWLCSVAAPVVAITPVGDSRTLAVATPSGVVMVTAGIPGAVVRTARLASLAYAPFESRFSTYGSGCASATSAPTLSASGSPSPGSVDFTARLRGGSASSTAFLLVGLHPRALPLDAIGMPACTLWVDPLDALPTRTTIAGSASIRLAIPADPRLVGNAVFLQWITLAPHANALQLLASEAGRAVP